MRKIALINFVTSFLTLLCYTISWSYSYGQQTKQLSVKPITNEDVKLISNIRNITQDTYGFLWIATQDGLYRYDSRTTETYNTYLDKKHTIESSDVRRILIDSIYNTIWFTSSGGGFHGVDLKTGIVHTKLNAGSILHDSVVFFSKLCDYHDSIIIATSRGAFVFNKKTRSLSKIIEFEKMEPDIDNAFIVNDNFIALTKRKGVMQYDLKEKKIIKIIPIDNKIIKTDTRFFDVTQRSELSYAATTEGIMQFRMINNEITIEKTAFDFIPPELNQLVLSLRFDNNDKLWFSNENHVVQADLKSKTYTIIENAFSINENWLNSVYTIFCDRENNVWLGCQQGLAMIKNKETAFKSYNSTNKQLSDLKNAYYIYPVSDSTIYLCSENGLFHIQTNNNRISSIDKTKAYDYIFTDPFGKLIVSNTDGFFEIKKDLLIPLKNIYHEFDLLGKVRVNSSILINDSCIAFGSENYQGVLIWNFIDHNVTSFTTASGTPSLYENVTNNLKYISNNVFAILGDSYFGIFDYVKKKYSAIQLVSQENKKATLFFDLCKIKNKFYLASYGSGVIILNEAFNKIGELSSKNGLSNNGVYKLLPWKDSLLFITTNNGLNCLDINTGKLKQFYANDGLHNNVFEETSGNIYNDVIYAGGKNGFTIISPQYIHPNTIAPVVYFGKVMTRLSNNSSLDTFNISANEYHIPNNALQTNVNFLAISFANPERTSFTYRIKEKSNDWIDLKNQNFVSLIGLSPGKYHLQVQAFNEDSVPSEIKELTLIFLPKWYQTWKFKVLVLLLILAAVYGLYRFRINHLKKEEKIRNQVASDLHDELGSTLNSVKVFTNLAMMEENKTPHLEKIKEATQSAISGVKDIIWVLDDKRDTLDHLLSRINQFAKPICDAAGISYNQQSGGNENYKLGKEEKRNLYMIIKESINNSIKYSDCSVIELLIKNKGGKINITVSDNGKGFDKGKTNNGYGLKNILRRAEEIKYHAEINSSLGNGTLIYLEKK